MYSTTWPSLHRLSPWNLYCRQISSLSAATLTMAMLQLPSEILVQIANDTRDLQDHLKTTRKLRLTCRALAATSAKTLFETIVILPARKSHRKCTYHRASHFTGGSLTPLQYMHCRNIPNYVVKYLISFSELQIIPIRTFSSAEMIS